MLRKAPPNGKEVLLLVSDKPVRMHFGNKLQPNKAKKKIHSRLDLRIVEKVAWRLFNRLVFKKALEMS